MNPFHPILLSNHSMSKIIYALNFVKISCILRVFEYIILYYNQGTLLSGKGLLLIS